MGALENVREDDTATQAALLEVRNAQLADSMNPTIETARRLAAAYYSAINRVRDERANLERLFKGLQEAREELRLRMEERAKRVLLRPGQSPVWR